MTKKNELSSLAGEMLGALGAIISPAIQEAAKEAGLSEISGWYHIQLATAIAPDAITVDLARVRSAYTSRGTIEEHFNGLSEHGFFAPAGGEGNFLATEKAQKAMSHILDKQREALVNIDVLPVDDVARLEELFGRIEEAAIALPEPPTPCLDDSLRRPQPPDLPVIDQFLRHMIRLGSFRDDAHLASWKPHNIDGHAWEIFTFIWNEEEMSEDLINARGYTPEDDKAAIQDLRDRGWIETADKDGKYRAAEKGKAVRQEAEDLTDRYFLAAWDCLSDDEAEELGKLIVRTRDKLRELAPEQPEQ